MRHGFCRVLLAGKTRYREFGAQTPMESVVGHVTVAAPLPIDTGSRVAPMKPINAKFWPRDAEP
jgi:hypothetical protein